MAAELARLGHPMLAALLTVGLSAPVQAETPPEALQPAQEAPLAEELELIKEEESVSIASRYDQPISQAALFSSEAMAVRETDDVKKPIECVLRWLMAREEAQDGFSCADGLV